MPSLLDKLQDIPFTFIDVETTGASTDYGDRVTEIGIVRVEGGLRVAEYQQLVDPQRRIGAGVVALTGITQAMVTGQPLFGDIVPRVIELMCGAVVVGHNVRFDLSFINAEFQRCRRHMQDCLGAVHVAWILSASPAGASAGAGNGLQHALAPRLGIEPTGAHRALADAITTALVFERLLEPVGGWGLSLCDAIMHQGGPMGLMPASPRESLLPLELQEALDQRCAVAMEYVDATGNRTERNISPQEIRRFKGDLVLIAHCHLRDERRNFKLDRIVRFTRIEPQPSTADEQANLFPAAG